jgi:pimeloyl-ACP methyl ester carboxylesterase
MTNKPTLDSPPKTYVLLHGAWHGAWCWKKVLPELLERGHRVLTPTQTGLGERSHLLSKDVNLTTFVHDLVNVLVWEDLSNVILVGHSFGGCAITAAADQMPERIAHLVYLDALILQDGESPFSTVPPEVAQSRRDLAQKTSAGLTIPVPSADKFGVTDPDDATWLMSRCTPHPIATYEEPLKLRHEPGNGLPTTYIAVTPYYMPTTASREYARARSDWSYVEIEAGHDAMVTSPKALAKILLNLGS